MIKLFPFAGFTLAGLGHFVNEKPPLGRFYWVCIRLALAAAERTGRAQSVFPAYTGATNAIFL
jgi:hypothetical protein